VPGIAISTDVIVGFCGETEASSRRRSSLLETSATTRSSPPPTRRPGTPATQLADDVPPPRSAAGSTSCSTSRRRSASSATGPGWVADRGPGRRSSCRRAAHDHEDDADGPARAPRGLPGPRSRAGAVHLTGRSRAQARPRRRDRRARRPPGQRPDRPRRAVRAAGSARLTVGAGRLPPLIVIGGSDRHRQDGPRDRARRSRCSPGSRSRSSRRTRGRSTGAGHRHGQADPRRARGVVHHLLDLVEPDVPFSVADFVQRGRAGPCRPGGPGRRCAARRWHRALAAGPGDRPRRRCIAGRRRACGRGWSVS
jgi:hypothetical protein